ncbi:MAG TPA: hypothetical protein VNV66_08310 [Pilimelia sp.]|nr:hypothetical protein [Pilimelia sp.]
MLVASPGVGSSTAEGLKLDGYASSAGRVWATVSENDRIRLAGFWLLNPILFSPILINGVDTTLPMFGARVFASAPGTAGDGITESPAHSEYWNDDTPTRPSIARIATGSADCGFIDTATIPEERDPSLGHFVKGCAVKWW